MDVQWMIKDSFFLSALVVFEEKNVVTKVGEAWQGRPCEDGGRGWNDGTTSQECPGPPGTGRGRKDPLLGSAEDARTRCQLESGFLALASVRGWIQLSQASNLWPQP